MKKGLMMMLFASMMAAAATAQVPEWLKMFKLSGYGMMQYQYTGQEGAKANSFNIRLGRVIIDAKPHKDWAARVQFQYNGNTADLSSSLKVVDVYAEWQKYEFFRVKAGQFKRAFTFENPMNPIDEGFMSYGQNVSQLAGFTDRDGAASSNGRDIGVQFQGDLLKNVAGRNLFHYQIAVYNGQGINQKDVDQQKDVIGGVWVMPVSGMRIGAFGMEGSYARTSADKRVVKLPQHRYALSAEYKFNDWTLRSEYIHSTGKAFKVRENSKADRSNTTINEAIGSKAEGVYALCIAPVIKHRLYAKARYDLYRQAGDWQSAKTNYEVGANYMFSKNLQLNLEYALVNNRALAEDHHNYSMFDAQLDFRF